MICSEASALQKLLYWSWDSSTGSSTLDSLSTLTLSCISLSTILSCESLMGDLRSLSLMLYRFGERSLFMTFRSKEAPKYLAGLTSSPLILLHSSLIGPFQDRLTSYIDFTGTSKYAVFYLGLSGPISSCRVGMWLLLLMDMDSTDF